MADHLSIGDVEPYRSRRLPVTELLSINDHLAGCVTCRELVEEPGKLGEAYSFAHALLGEDRGESGSHLSYEQVERYVDDRLSEQDRNVVDIHLETCRECETDADDLKQTRAGMFSDVVRMPKDSSRRLPTRSHPSRISRYGIPLQSTIMITVAISLALGAGLVTALLVRGRIAKQEAQLSEVRAKAEELQRGLEESKGVLTDLQGQLEGIREAAGGPSIGGVRILLNDAHGNVTLDTQGTVTGLGFLGPGDERLISEALTTGRVRTPASLSRLYGKRKNLMGTTPKDSFTLLSPVGTFVLTDRPTLKWESLSGATGYEVTILDSGFNEVETSPMLSGTEWRVTRPLRPGGIYMWQVRAVRDGNEIRSPSTDQGEAKFRVLDQSKVREVERAKQTYAASHLAMGVIYAEAGLLDEANREFEALAAANPHSRLVRSLMKSLNTHPAKARAT